MSTSVAASDPRRSEFDRTRAGTAPERGERWVVGGVAAELGERLGVSVGFVRALLLLGALAQGDLILAYLLAALVLPRAGRRTPSAANLIAVARVGLAGGLVWGLVGGGLPLGGGLFDQSPAVWVTQCGVCLAGLLALLATGVPAGEREAARDRTAVCAAAPVVGLLALTALGVFFLPGVRWERVLAVVAILSGIGILLPGRAAAARALVVPAAVVSAATLLLVGAGVRLEGGVGDRRVTPLRAGAIPVTYRRALGDLTVNLTSLPASSVWTVVRASVGIGTLVIDVPGDAEVSTVEQVGRGELDRPGPHFGLDLRRVAVIPALDSMGRTLARPRLRLRILAAVGIGHLVIDWTGPDEFGER